MYTKHQFKVNARHCDVNARRVSVKDYTDTKGKNSVAPNLELTK